MVAISSCVTGEKCRYNASDSYNPMLIKDNADNYIAICPEMLADLSIPREPCEIVGGCGEDVIKGTARIMDKNGTDITETMICGARKALQICLEHGIDKAYLQTKSPTCGCGKIYDGSFSGTLKAGDGIFTVLLKMKGIEVVEVI